MSDDLLTRFQRAAATPTGDAPLSAIEQRLRSRRRRRRGAALLCACALVAGVSSAVALGGGDGPSVKTLTPASQTASGHTEPPVTVELPDGWVESPINGRVDNNILTVGTALQPRYPHEDCMPDADLQDDVFIRLHEYTALVLLEQGLPGPPLDEGGYSVLDLDFPPRPDDFATAPAERATCLSGGAADWAIVVHRFKDNNRDFQVIVSAGPGANDARIAEAFQILNSLKVEPISVPLLPPTTVPPSTVPASDETRAVAAAFDTWLDTQPRDDPAVGAVIEDFEAIKASIQEAAAKAPLPLAGYEGGVDAVLRITETEAEVIYSITNDGASVLTTTGRAVKVDGVWKVSRETVCAALEVGGTRCPPRES